MSLAQNNIQVSSLPGDALLVRAEQWIAAKFPARQIRRVLFVNPPDGTTELFQIAKAKRRRYTNYPPYGLGVLAQQARNIGVNVEILNLNNEVLSAARAEDTDETFDFDEVWVTKLDETVATFRPDVIGVTCMFTMTHESLVKVCRQVSSLDIPLVIGGVHVTNDVERVLNEIPEADAAFLRESDNAFPQFIRAVNGDVPVDILGQMIMIEGRDRFRLTGDMSPKTDEMDVIPAYDLMDIGDLSMRGVIGNFHGFRSKDTAFATCLSNRGCRGQCTFCSVRNFNGKSVRQRSVENVLDELQILKEEYGIGHIVWLDDDLLKDEKRAIELFNGMVKRNLGLTWDATNGVIAASCKDEVVRAMAASGCIALNIGMESGNPQILKQVRKPGTVNNFLAAAEVFKKYPQIHARVFIMIGFPGETLAQINDTINVCRQMDLDWFSITPLQPLPNTPIFEEMIEEGIIESSDDSTEVRFMAGGYGKQDDIETGLRIASKGFVDAFCSIPMDAVPTRAQIDDIWFYMNYHLNFHRLFSEDHRTKLEQQLKHLWALSDVISPDHGFGLYFIGYIQNKLDGRIDPVIIKRLKKKMETSEYWRERMTAFGLHVEDLIDGNFRNKEIPRFLPGQLPHDDRSFEDTVHER